MIFHLLVAALLLLAGSARAQTKPIRPDQVPPLAFVALQTQFPQARQVQWELALGPLYRANFTRNDTRQAAFFSKNGDLAATAVEVAAPALPAPVRHALATYYPGLQLRSVAKMRNAATGALTYEAQLLDSGTTCVVLYNPDGREVRLARRKKK